MGGGYVLVVDDDQAIRTLVMAALADEGIPSTALADAGAALALIKERRPSIIFLDTIGEPLSDAAFVATVRQFPGPHCPIIVFSAWGDGPAHAARISAEGALDKPFNLVELLAMVRRYVG